MKTVLIAVLASVLIASAFAATTCTNLAGTQQDCKGPVQITYTGSDCSGTKTYTMLSDGNQKGGSCYATVTGGSKHSGSSKGTCGTSMSGRSYATNDCSGPYAYSSIPTNKCFKYEATGTSFKYMCASASTATFSIALLVLMAILAILNL